MMDSPAPLAMRKRKDIKEEIKEELSHSDDENDDNLCFEDFEPDTDKTWEKRKRKRKSSKSSKLSNVDKKLYAKRTNYSMFKYVTLIKMLVYSGICIFQRIWATILEFSDDKRVIV